MFWATKHLAQVRVPRLSEKSWGCVVLLEHLAQAESPVLGDRLLHKRDEKDSPKREFVEWHCNELAQAREPSLSKTGLVAWAKAFSLSEISAVLCFKTRRSAQVKSLSSAWATPGDIVVAMGFLLSCGDMSEVGSHVPCSHLRDAACGEVRNWWIMCVGLRAGRSVEQDYERGEKPWDIKGANDATGDASDA
ncbi:hypothetical protein DEO72_LG3g1037 [Vigna unguiculata]|uniref:Uncharacterized protein n=1 Tax=Vigna unguiculata TaxID=3917 RepID=A0A4D6LE14_VIGUN|nr:hypothetical protein DEO72_LG3g1037 [Vigna unguiculata]